MIRHPTRTQGLTPQARLTGRAWFRKYMPPEVYPLVGIMGIMVSGATFMLYRISQSSDVVWDRKGDWKPWDKVSTICSNNLSTSSTPR